MSVNVLDAALREQYDQRTCSQRIIDNIVALVKDIYDCLIMGIKMVFGSQNYHYLDRKYAWKKDEETDGLIVLIHGLFAHPSCWDKHLAHIDSGFDVFVPFVPNKGNCSLEEAALPIYEHVKEYAKAFPNRKICVIGHSNGGRIADYIENQLRSDSPTTSVKISTIAGVHFGSRLQNIVVALKLHKLLGGFWSSVMSEELSYSSTKANEILHNLQTPLVEGVASRKYEFWGTLDDVLVPDLDSVLPRIHKGEQYYVRQRVGHCALIGEIAEEQMEKCKEWFRSQV